MLLRSLLVQGQGANQALLDAVNLAQRIYRCYNGHSKLTPMIYNGHTMVTAASCNTPNTNDDTGSDSTAKAGGADDADDAGGAGGAGDEEDLLKRLQQTLREYHADMIERTSTVSTA
jgi:hypothetical protein